MAAEVAYYTYMYAKVERKKYQVVSGHVKAALLSGRFIASLLGQVLYAQEIMDLRELNYITLSAQGLSFFFAIMLPSVGVSLYFYASSPQNPLDDANDKESIDMSSIDNLAHKIKPSFSGQRAAELMYKHLLESYSKINAITLPSIWWSLAMCGFLQVQSYVQFLWIEIDPDRKQLYNGAVEAGLTLLGALSALLAGSINMKLFEKYNMWILAICACLEGIFILISALTNYVAVAYGMYISFGVLYSFMITLL